MIRKQLVLTIDPHTKLFRDLRTGLAWVENGHTGLGHSRHPNIHLSGSVHGMKLRGYWGKDDRVVRSHGFKYNISHVVPDETFEALLTEHCHCGGPYCKGGTS